MSYDQLIANQTREPQSTTRRVIGWTSYADVELRGIREVAMWGGFMKRGDRWKDYIALVDPALLTYYTALRKAIVELRIKRGGDWHQADSTGVPVFDDGAVALFSFRAWGDFMAAVWSDEEGRDYEYMDFYMDSCLEDAGIMKYTPLI